MTLSILTKALRTLALPPPEQKRVVAIIKNFVLAIFQTLVQTVKIISDSGRAGLMEILENVDDDTGMFLMSALNRCAAVHTDRAAQTTLCCWC